MGKPVHAALDGSQHAGTHWHILPGHDVSGRLEVDPSAGLPHHEADSRLTRHGANTIREKPPRPLWRMFLDQFLDFMILVLVASAIVSGIVGDVEDTIAIVVNYAGDDHRRSCRHRARHCRPAGNRRGKCHRPDRLRTGGHER